MNTSFLFTPSSSLADKRLKDRGAQLEEKMSKNNTAILNQLSENRGEYVGFCRFVSNPKVTPNALIKNAIDTTSSLVKGKEVLVINDTTEFNYEHHRNYLDRDDLDLGPTGNNQDIGFFLHPGYVLDAQTGIGLGFSYIKLWNREFNKQDKNQRNYKSQPIQQKESYRWIECGNQSKSVLSQAKHITIIADRESDIYEEFVEVPDKKTDLLIRSQCNRVLADDHQKLYEKISSTPCQGTFMLDVKKHKTRSSRLATIEVRYQRLKIKRPGKHIKKDQPENIEVNVVEAKEQAHSVPEGEAPICWVLLTTLPINHLEEAKEIIKKYRCRWEVELLFATMKSKGLNVELSQLETGKSLKVLCVMALTSALRIMQLRQSRNQGHQINAQVAFRPGEIELLEILTEKYQGKTQKQKNPFKKYSMAWAAWTIARIGGWKGYKSESPPGFKTFTIGLAKFDNLYEGYEITK